MSPKKILGREPAVFFALVAAVLLAVIKFLPFDVQVSGALNAAVLAAAGVATAVTVSVEKVLPALTGLVQAVFAVYLAFGTPVPESTQTGILALLVAVAGFFVRQNVEAPRDAYGLSTKGVHDRLTAAYDNGYQAGQDEAVSTDISYEEPARPRETGAYGHTEVMPSVGQIYGEDDKP